MSVKYSTIAAADELRDPLAQAGDGPMPTDVKNLQNAVKKLAKATKDVNLIKNQSLSKLQERLSLMISDETKMKPFISASSKIAVLPKAFEEEDYYLGNYMIAVCKDLGLEVYLVDYKGKVDSLTDRAERIGLGIYLSLNDHNRNITVKEKKELIEFGRAIVRGQQTVKVFTSPALGMDALIRDNRMFGNQPGQIIKVEGQTLKVVPIVKEFDSLFRETQWRSDLRPMLRFIMRESAQFLGEPQIKHMIADNLMTRDQLIATYCQMPTGKTVKGSGKKKKQVLKVPSRPKASPLMTTKEGKFISDLASTIFLPPTEEEGDWFKYITDYGFSVAKNRIQYNYRLRSQYTQGFSRITTSRLREFRQVNPAARYKKKKDIAGEDTLFLLSLRKDLAEKFAQELLYLDPLCEKALMPYNKTVIKGTTKVLDTPEVVKELVSVITLSGVYDESSTELISAAKTAVEESRKRLEKIQLKILNPGTTKPKTDKGETLQTQVKEKPVEKEKPPEQQVDNKPTTLPDKAQEMLNFEARNEPKTQRSMPVEIDNPLAKLVNTMNYGKAEYPVHSNVYTVRNVRHILSLCRATGWDFKQAEEPFYEWKWLPMPINKEFMDGLSKIMKSHSVDQLSIIYAKLEDYLSRAKTDRYGFDKGFKLNQAEVDSLVSEW